MRRLAPLGLLLISLLSTPAAAGAIEPYTIFDLIPAADLIVLAQVVRVDEDHSDRHPWDYRDVAVLEVIQTWKGTLLREVRVSFNSHLTCPAPARYLPGRRVVAFLRRSDRDQDWETIALSYGTRYPVGKRGEIAFAEQVRRALIKRRPFIDVALDAAAERETRWDGLHMLTVQLRDQPDPDDDAHLRSDPTGGYYDRYGRKLERAFVLPPRVLDGLERIMVATPSFDRTLPKMLRLLKDRPSHAVTAAAADAIETVLHESSAPAWMDEALDLFAERVGLGQDQSDRQRPEADETLEVVLGSRVPDQPWSGPQPSQTREERVQRRWEQLKRQTRLEPRVLADFQREDWTGTGPQTPP